MRNKGIAPILILIIIALAVGAFIVVSKGSISLPILNNPPSNSNMGKLEAKVFVGPTSPVCKIGELCTGVYKNSSLTIYKESGAEVTKVTTNDNGEFTVSLPSGKYFIGTSNAPKARVTNFEIISNQTTKLTINIDTGLR